MRGLIDARDDKKKEETYYTVTFDFLKFLGLNEVGQLPDYQRLHADDTIDRILAEDSQNKAEEAALSVSEAGVEGESARATDEMTPEQKAAVFSEALSEVAEAQEEVEDEEEFDDEDDEFDEDEEDEPEEDGVEGKVENNNKQEE
jgi:hypothetical protein